MRLLIQRRAVLIVAGLMAATLLVALWSRVGDGAEDHGVSHDLGGQPFIVWKSPRAMPVVSFQDARGEPVTLAHFRGRAILINVWATWCPPCRTEMPALDRLNARRGGARFEVIAVSIDRDPTAARAFLDSMGIRSLHGHFDPTGTVGSTLGSFAVPLTLLVGPDGRELGRALGPVDWDGPRFDALLSRLLAAAP